MFLLGHLDRLASKVVYNGRKLYGLGDQGIRGLGDQGIRGLGDAIP